MVKIFFGCSMRGGFSRLSLGELEKFPKLIEECGYSLMSKHQTSATFESDEAHLSNTKIHDRDYKWLMEADVGIFEISNPSLGVGGEISDILHLGKPVLCLFKKGLDGGVSGYIQGKQGSKYVKTPFEVSQYANIADARAIIRKFVEANPKTGK